MDMEKNDMNTHSIGTNTIASSIDELPIVFNTSFRKAIVECIIQGIKELFESKTSGLTITYEENDLPNHEFYFKMHAEMTSNNMQVFSEVTNALRSTIDYAFQGDTDYYDVSICVSKWTMDVEIASNW